MSHVGARSFKHRRPNSPVGAMYHLHGGPIAASIHRRCYYASDLQLDVSMRTCMMFLGTARSTPSLCTALSNFLCSCGVHTSRCRLMARVEPSSAQSSSPSDWDCRFWDGAGAVAGRAIGR